MSNNDTLNNDTPEQTTEVGFHVAPTFSELMAQRPAKAASGLPLATVVQGLLMNGAADVYEKYVAPVMAGEISYGNLVANEAVIGFKLMEHDAAHDNMLKQARVPKSGPITAQLVGKKVREIAAKTYRLEKRSFIAAGLLTQQD